MNLINKLGIGTAQFGMPYGISNNFGQTKPKEVSQILEYSHNIGINVIDTASSYGNAENILGCNNLNDFKIISKFILNKNDISINEMLSSSFSRLNIKSIYGFLAHSPQNLLSKPEIWDELKELKNEKLIHKIGFSLNEPYELVQLLDKGIIPDLIQVPYNYFDKRFQNLLISLKKNGCEIHSRSTFLQGLFFINPNTLPAYFDDVKDIIVSLQNNYSNNLPCALLKHVLELDFIDIVVMGVENLSQLSKNTSMLESNIILPDLDHFISDSILQPSNWPIRHNG
jgi:aryl-alcohol dehydrogenase-like predicted oxidoreductase